MIWHPSRSSLALVRTGDLPFWKQRLVERHLRCCGLCSQQADSLAETRAELRRQWPEVKEPAGLADQILAAIVRQESQQAPSDAARRPAAPRAVPPAAFRKFVVEAAGRHCGAGRPGASGDPARRAAGFRYALEALCANGHNRSASRHTGARAHPAGAGAGCL